MSSINIKFYATFDEARQWIKAACEQEEMIILLATFRPAFALTEVTWDTIPPAGPKEVAQRLYFLFELPHTRFRTHGEFAASCPEKLLWDIGQQTSDGLYESWLASPKDDLKASTKWKAVLQQIRQNTKVGLTLYHRQTGAGRFTKNYRYSAGALALQKEGIGIVPLQGPGGPIYRLGPQSSETAHE